VDECKPLGGGGGGEGGGGGGSERGSSNGNGVQDEASWYRANSHKSKSDALLKVEDKRTNYQNALKKKRRVIMEIDKRFLEALSEKQARPGIVDSPTSVWPFT